jgi:hypothetical protein
MFPARKKAIKENNELFFGDIAAPAISIGLYFSHSKKNFYGNKRNNSGCHNNNTEARTRAV